MERWLPRIGDHLGERSGTSLGFLFVPPIIKNTINILLLFYRVSKLASSTAIGGVANEGRKKSLSQSDR